MPFVAYLRVSTQRQGASGLGIEAQTDSVTRYATQVGQPIVATFVEIESGAKKARPQLAASLVREVRVPAAAGAVVRRRPQIRR